MFSSLEIAIMVYQAKNRKRDYNKILQNKLTTLENIIIIALSLLSIIGEKWKKSSKETNGLVRLKIKLNCP